LWIFSSKIFKNLSSHFSPILVGGTGVDTSRLRAIEKLPFGILLAVASNLISMQKTETL